MLTLAEKDIRLMKLLEGVKEHGSLYKACQDVCVYSCAWTTIHRVEEAYGITLTTTNGPSGSEITLEGELVYQYLKAANKSTQSYKDQLFKELHEL